MFLNYTEYNNNENEIKFEVVNNNIMLLNLV